MSIEKKLNDFLEKVGEKDLDAVYEKIKTLMGDVVDWNQKFSETLQTEEDKKFYREFSKLPEASCNQVFKKIKKLGEHIAQKIGDELDYVEENDGMTFIHFENQKRSLYCNRIYHYVNFEDLELSEKVKESLENERQVYIYLEKKYEEMLMKEDYE